ncbi:MAG: tetratricopeptide repeat protein [Acidobacteriota bacterium]|nr:tetratricopeptide repeat protein [Acidobacteriota bacterium]
MVTGTEQRTKARRKLMLRDALSFLGLLAITGVLFVVTLLLFRSFTHHRDDLARRWADRGANHMSEGHPDQAIVALRTALNYAPGDRKFELLLAQALAQAGRTDESYAYFSTLREGEPGSGFINLQLARLAAGRGESSTAAELYRASIYGTWEGDGVVRRAAVRLELARFLIHTGQLQAARMELLIAAGNAPETAALDRTVARLLVDAQDPADAWSYYRKAVALSARDVETLAEAGRYAYRIGEFSAAQRLLTRAEALRADAHLPPDAELAALRSASARIGEIVPAASLPPGENARRVLELRRLAKRRLDRCLLLPASPGAAGKPPALQTLAARWSAPEGTAAGGALRDPAAQDATMHLIYETELATDKVCAPATGDDALLLHLATQSGTPLSQGRVDSVAVGDPVVGR